VAISAAPCQLTSLTLAPPCPQCGEELTYSYGEDYWTVSLFKHERACSKEKQRVQAEARRLGLLWAGKRGAAKRTLITGILGIVARRVVLLPAAHPGERLLRAANPLLEAELRERGALLLLLLLLLQREGGGRLLMAGASCRVAANNRRMCNRPSSLLLVNLS
jgi:hypothetical protein